MIYLLLFKSWEISRRLNFQGLVVGAKWLSTPAIQSLFLKSFGSGAISIWMTFHSLHHLVSTVVIHFQCYQVNISFSFNLHTWRNCIIKQFHYLNVQLYLFLKHSRQGITHWNSQRFCWIKCKKVNTYSLCVGVCVCVCARAHVCSVAKSCLTLCNPVDCNLPGSSVHGIAQARILEWVAIFFLQWLFQTQGLNQISPKYVLDLRK